MARNIALDDFTRLKLVSDPQITQDSARAACVVTEVDTEKNRYRNAIWVTPTAGGEPRRYTSEESGSSMPRWSPDGSQLAFLSDRRKPMSQIYLLPADGGEARALTRLETEGSIRGLRWSPDGKQIAFLFRATPVDYRKDSVEERKKKELSSPVRHHTRLFYRLDGSGYFDGEYTQVWVAEVQTGQCRQLTAGDYDCGLPVWSPDSHVLAFISDRREDADVDRGHDDIYTVAAEGGDLNLVPTPSGPKSALAWSPDGAHFAYVGNPECDDPWGTNNNRLMVIPAGGAEMARDLTGSYDISVGYDTLADAHEIGAGDLIQWTADCRSLLFPASIRGDTRLCRIVVTGNGAPLFLTAPGGEMGGFSVGHHGAIAFTRGAAVTLHELFLLQNDNALTALTPLQPGVAGGPECGDASGN